MTTDDLELKQLSKSGVEQALDLAHRYRLFNEPYQAESICRDVLRVDPDNETALKELILALTERFEQPPRAKPRTALELLPRFAAEFDRIYYEGIIHERSARAVLRLGTPRCGEVAYEGFRRAMDCYERADELGDERHELTHLRWNTCVRTLRDNPAIHRAPKDDFKPLLE